MVDKNIEELRCDYVSLSQSRLDFEECLTSPPTHRPPPASPARVQIFYQLDHVRAHSVQLEYLPQAPLTRSGPGATAHPGYGVAHQKGLHNISHSHHGERKTVSYVQPVGASEIPTEQGF
eukprot:365796-Chlamydomonas_euryale.AAC.16